MWQGPLVFVERAEMPKRAIQIVIFLDVNAGEMKECFRDFHPQVKVVYEEKFGRLSDKKLINLFERESVKYKGCIIFALTHDKRFERNTKWKFNKSNFAIIKTPQPSKQKILSELAVDDLKSFLNMLLSCKRPMRFFGILRI